MVERHEKWPRRCPDCGTEFESVQCWGICPSCDLRFLVDYNGDVLENGNRPLDRSRAEPMFVPHNVEQLAVDLPLEIRSRVQSRFELPDVGTALRLLACYGTRTHEVSPEWAWILSLDASAGSLQLLESAIKLAQKDWRDFKRLYEGS